MQKTRIRNAHKHSAFDAYDAELFVRVIFDDKTVVPSSADMFDKRYARALMLCKKSERFRFLFFIDRNKAHNDTFRFFYIFVINETAPLENY